MGIGFWVLGSGMVGNPIPWDNDFIMQQAPPLGVPFEL